MSSSDAEHGASEEVLSPDGGASARQRRKWTKQEDERLRLLVSYWGDQGGRRSNWDKISANFEDRSSKDCRKRWFHSLDPKLRRGKWSKSEDKVLKEAYQRLGPAWQRIAQLIPGRTDDQCAKRYNDVLDPSVQDRLRPWTKAEDEQLLGLHAKHGAKWQTISRCLEGRTGLTCRNRWRKLTRPSRTESAQQSSAEGDADADAGPGALEDAARSAPEPPRTSEGPLASGLSFDVPGSSMVAGYPAGAEPNWLLGGGGGPGGPGGPFGPHRNLTMTIEDPSEPPQNALQQMHHTISEIHLGRILQHAAEHKQQIVIHQHIYQTVPPAGTISGEPVLQRGTHAPMMQQAPQPPPHAQHQPAPHAPHAQQHAAHTQHVQHAQHSQHSQHAQHAPHAPHAPQPPPEHVAIAANSAPMAARANAPALAAQPPPPDEFLGRPLLFDESQPPLPMPRSNHMFDADAIDFLAFNPS